MISGKYLLIIWSICALLTISLAFISGDKSNIVPVFAQGGGCWQSLDSYFVGCECEGNPGRGEARVANPASGSGIGYRSAVPALVTCDLGVESCQTIAAIPGDDITCPAPPTPTPTPTPEICDDGVCSGQEQIICAQEDLWCNPETGCCSQPSPIVIDVLGNGFSLTSKANGVLFSMNGGPARQLPWTSAGTDDAWLVFDRNGNGTIDNGTELFGNFTPQPTPLIGIERNGFLALAVFDDLANGGNSDGIISRQDLEFRRLRLWQDLNHNGISESSEIFRLTQLGLKKIDLDYHESERVDQFGNEFRFRVRIRDANDEQLGRWAWDVYLVAE